MKKMNEMLSKNVRKRQERGMIEDNTEEVGAMGGIGPMSLIIISIVALLIFGPRKLPELGKAMGSTLREFKNATRGLADDDDTNQEKKKL